MTGAELVNTATGEVVNGEVAAYEDPPELDIPDRAAPALPADFLPRFTAQIAKVERLDVVLEARRRVAALNKYVARKADKDAVRHGWLLTGKRVGELLGPAPEVGSDYGRGRETESPTSDSIDKQDRYRFRLLAEHWDDVAERMIADGTLSQSAIISEIERRRRQTDADPVTLPEGIDIRCCAAADLALDADSVDLILTDPPYGLNSLHCWEDLARLAKHALRPGGLLVTYSGQLFLREAIDALSDLEYVWVAAIVHDSPFFQLRKHKIQVGWKPLLVFGKPPLAITSEWSDTLTDGHREKKYHGWGQAQAEAAQVINTFTVPDDLVVDPFLGGGTTAVAAKQLNRSFIGCDIDDAKADAARGRLS